MKTAFLILAAVVVLLSATPAGAAPSRNCRSVQYGFQRYQVVAHGLGCKKARKGVKRYLKRGGRLPHYHCSPPSTGSNVKVSCMSKSKPKNDSSVRYYLGVL